MIKVKNIRGDSGLESSRRRVGPVIESKISAPVEHVQVHTRVVVGQYLV